MLFELDMYFDGIIYLSNILEDVFNDNVFLEFR